MFTFPSTLVVPWMQGNAYISIEICNFDFLIFFSKVIIVDKLVALDLIHREDYTWYPILY